MATSYEGPATLRFETAEYPAHVKLSTTLGFDYSWQGSAITQHPATLRLKGQGGAPRPAPWVVYGVPSYQPLTPTLTDNDAVTQIPLAYVHVAAGQAAIMDCHITPIVDDRIPAILYELARR